MIVAISLGLFVSALDLNIVLQGLYLVLATGAGFVLPTVGVNGIYNDMSLKLFTIAAGYHLVGFAVA